MTVLPAHEGPQHRLIQPRIVLPTADGMIRIGLIQADPRDLLSPGAILERSAPNYDEVRERYERSCLNAIQSALNRGASLIVLPEYSLTASLAKKIVNLVSGMRVMVVAGTHRFEEVDAFKSLGQWLEGAPDTGHIGRNLGLVICGDPLELVYVEKVSPEWQAEQIDYHIAKGNTILTLDVKYEYLSTTRTFQLGILICHDFLRTDLRGMCLAAGSKLILIPAYTATTTRFEYHRIPICEDYQGVVCLVNVSNRELHYGGTQVWAFRPVPHPEQANLANEFLVGQVKNFGMIVFNFRPDSLYRAVQTSEGFEPLVDPRFLSVISFDTDGKEVAVSNGASKVGPDGQPTSEQDDETVSPSSVTPGDGESTN